MTMTKEKCLERISDAIYTIGRARMYIEEIDNVKNSLLIMPGDPERLLEVTKRLGQARVMDTSSMVLRLLHEARDELQKLNVQE